MADGTVTVSIKADTTEYKAKVASLGSETASALNEVGSASGDVSSKLSAASVAAGAFLGNLATSALSSVTGGIKELASSVVEVGSTFESSMSNVAALSGATGSELAKLESTAREMGSTTVFSASECADALGYMALAGWDVDQSIDGLPGVLNLAAASGMDLAEASDMVTDYLTAFGLEASDASGFADQLAYAQSNSNTTAEQLGEAYKNCAANLNAAGQDVETTTSLLSMMANQGLKGSEAGTALAAVMRDITSNMEDGAIKIGETSVAVTDSEGNFRDLTDILTDVEAATEGMGDAETAAALGATFTADSTKGLNLILNAGVSEAAAFEEQLRNCSGTASEMATVMNDNLEGDLKTLNSAMEELQLKMYDGVEPGLRAVATAATETLVPALTAMVEGADGAGAQLGEAFGTMLTTINEQITALAPQAATMAAQVVSAVVQGIIEGLPSLIECIATIAASLLTAIGTEVPNIVNAAAQTIPQLAAVLGEAVPTILAAGIQMFTAIADAIPQVLPSIISGLTGCIPSFVSAVVSGLPSVLAAAVQLFTSIVTAITTVLPSIISGLTGMIPSMVSALVSNIPQILQAGVQLLQALITAIPQVLPQIVAALPQIITSIVSGIISGLPQMLSAGADLIGGLATGIANAIPNLLSSALEACGQLLSSVKSFFGIHSPSRVFKGIGKMDMRGLSVGLEDETPATVKVAKAEMADVLDAVQAELETPDLGKYSTWAASSAALGKAAGVTGGGGGNVSTSYTCGNVIVQAKDAQEAGDFEGFMRDVMRRAGMGV